MNVLRALALLIGCATLATGQTPRGRTVHGTVVDAETSSPLADVAVAVGDRTVFTSADGRFSVPVQAGTDLLVRRLGYRPSRVRVTDQDSLRVALQPVGQPLESVVITAARREQRFADAVVATELISRRAIEQRAATDVAAALTDAPGVQAEGGIPSGSGVLLQGLGSQRVLVLVDGQPLIGRINGNLDLSRVSTTGVERIEIVKGPQSTLYGSEAMGGVINIITRRPRLPGLAGELSTIAGSQGRREAGFTLLGLTRDYAMSATLDGGVRSLNLVPGRGDNSATFARRADLAPSFSWRPTNRISFDVASGATVERQRYRLGQLYQHSDNSQISARVGVSRISEGQRATLTAYASRFAHLSRRSTTPDPASDAGERDRQTLLKLDLNGSTTVGRVVLDGGVEARNESIVADRVEEARSISGVEPFVQSTITLGSLSVVPGVRMSWSDQWGSATTPRLAMLWRPVAPVAVRASIGTGFRAPDFKELHLEFVNTAAGYAVRGNPSLEPEHSRSASAGVEWTASLGSAGVSGYQTRYSDFIEAGETATPGEYTYSNVASGRIYGVDLNGSLGVSARRVDASYSFLDAKSTSGAPLLGRARHAAQLGVSVANRAETRLSLSAGFTSRTPVTADTAGEVTRWRASRTRVDARIAQRIRRSLTLGFSLENVLDQRTGEDWPGYDGRLWSVSARLSR